jgi:hypothetical protein
MSGEAAVAEESAFFESGSLVRFGALLVSLGKVFRGSPGAGLLLFPPAIMRTSLSTP